MNVRDYLYPKKHKQALIMYSLLIMALLVIKFGPSIIGATNAIYVAAFLGISFLVFAVMLNKYALCPKCNFNFYHFSVRKKKNNQVNFCPGCGLQLDSEYSNAP
jgi:hypothetical protein